MNGEFYITRGLTDNDTSKNYKTDREKNGTWEFFTFSCP